MTSDANPGILGRGMGERLFYVSVGGGPGKGPFTLDDVRTRKAGGSLPADTLVCEVGSTEWRMVAWLDSPDAPAPSGPLPPLPPPPPPKASVASQRRSGMGRIVAIAAGILGVVVLGAGLAGFLWTRATAPKLCAATPRLLTSLHSQLTVVAYVTRGLPTLDAFVVHLQKLFAQYQSASGGHFTFSIVEAKDEESKRSAKLAGLIEQPFGEASGSDPDTAKLTQGFMGLVFKYGEQQDVLKFLPPDRTDGLEFWIDNKIRELAAKTEGRHYRIGILTGDREIAPGEDDLVPASMGKFSVQGIITQNFPFYSFVDVDLHGGSAEIDPDLQGLVVTQPESDLSDAALARIDAFVLQGKPVAFFVGAANVARGDASMHATLATHGLERLLAGYGIELGRDVVLDMDAKASVALPSATGVTTAKLPFVPLVLEDDHRLDATFPAFFRLEEVALPLASSLVLHREKQPDALLRELARSSPHAVRLGGDVVDLLHPLEHWDPAGAQGPVVLAAAADGTIRGAFDPSRKSSRRARVLVIASSQFLANPLARAGSPGEPTSPPKPAVRDEAILQLAGPYAQQQITGTILVFKNTLDWLSFEDDFADCGLIDNARRRGP